MEFYALRHKDNGKLMRLRVVSNPTHAYAFNNTYVTLVPSNSYNEFVYVLFTTETYEDAERVSNYSGDWYKSTIKNPINNYVGELEVVKLTMTVV